MRKWIEDEFEHSDFKDERLRQRFFTVATAFSESPSSSISARSSDWAEAKGAYRLFKNDNFTSDDFLIAHKNKTAERASAYPFILAIQDTTTLNYMGHSRENGMGLTRNDSWGCHLHSTIAIAPNGLFLGVLSNLLWFRDPDRKKKVNDKPIYLDGEDKESEKWNEGLEDTLDSLKNATKVLSVCDREADSKTFIVNSQEMGTDFLIRHSSPRKINESTLSSYDYVKNSNIQGRELVTITNKWTDNRGKSLRVKDEYGRYQRETTLNYQFVQISTDIKIASLNQTVNLSIVRVFEEDKGNGKIDWTLLTSLPIKTLEEAKAMVLYYSLRWRIELFFKTLKSGCHVEKCRLSKFDRMKKFINLSTIVAWRINWIKYLNEIRPDACASEVLSDQEVMILKRRMKHPSHNGITIKLALLWVARLGGHLNRKNDGPPGLETIWKGMSRLHDLEEGFSLA